ncbi:MAG: hypothetical protein QGD90_02615 [Candidatus Hydrogenedentes bacterium]|nr:hypothetical protein [Candidatus Hydrogenedentota bacterium]
MKLHCSGLIGVVCFLGLQGLALAGGPAIFSVQNGPWSDPDTWDAGVPDAGVGNDAKISHVVGVTAAGQGAGGLSVGYSAGAGTLNISSGDLTIGGTLLGSDGNSGTVNLSGGTFTLGSLLVINLGTFNMTGGSLVAVTVDIPDNFISGNSGSLALSGGTLSLSGVMTIGGVTFSDPGTLTIEGGAGSFEGTNGGIDGTVHFTSESTLVIRPDGPTPNTNLTRINVGTVNIDTGATLEFDPQYSPQIGDNWFIFISQNPVGGTEPSANFTNVVTPAGFTISQDVALTRGFVPEKMTVTVTAVPVPATWVDFAFGDGGDGSESNPWNTLAEGLADVAVGGAINIKGNTGVPFTTEKPTISQDVILQAPSGPVTIGITSGAAGESSESGFVSRGNKR